MSTQGDVFEPDVIRKVLKNLAGTQAEKRQFESNWKENVEKRVKGWLNHRDKQSKSKPQLEWEAEVVEYVDYLHRRTSLHKNSKAVTPPSLPTDIPLLGPRFCPPTYLHYMRRSTTPKIVPAATYLMPLTVIHPVFYPGILDNCPECASSNTLWDGWTATGAREVHGIRREERALGYQLRCKDCKAKYGKGGTEYNEAASSHGYCFAATSSLFWKKWDHWRMPRGVPCFRTRTAVTRELHDLVVELRPSTTSAGLAEHIQQLHLLEYHIRKLEYLSCFQAARPHPFLGQRTGLEAFSEPSSEDGYNDASITNDLITDVYLDFIKQTRSEESQRYCRTRTGKSLSLDNTFKSARKAVIIDKDKTRTKMFNGGILSVINERSETMAWRFCQSASPEETREVLGGIKMRHEVLKIPQPKTVVVDNCCQVRRYVSAGLPGADVVLDVHHFMARYGGVIMNGTRNPHRSQVLQDIRNSIIKQPAGKNGPAKYWEKDEQVKRLEEAFEKWSRHGDVWLASASKVHADQLAHVKKGCLARGYQDIAADGSRIEGSHKAWNSLQRAQPSGIEVYSGLAHDFVLRRNLRIGSARLKDVKNFTTGSADIFVLSAHESHHISLVNYVAHLFNTLSQKELPSPKLRSCTTLPCVESGEVFGLVESANTTSFGGLFTIKEEAEHDPDLEAVDEMLEDMGTSDSYGSQTAIPEGITAGISGKRKVPEGGNITREGPEETTEFPPAKRLCQHERNMHPRPPGHPVILETELASTPIIVDHQITAPEVRTRLSDVDTFFRPVLQKNQAESSSLALAVGIPGIGSSQDVSISQQRLDSLMAPLSPPPPPCKLTRSQLLFSLATSIDPRSLSIKEKSEFFLFMDMRAEFQWATFSMTSQKWVTATRSFNTRLETQGRRAGENAVKKNPRALMEKLGEVEGMVAKRVTTGNYTSRRSGTDIFWRKHCAAVQAVIKSESVDASVEGAAGTKKRKLAICSRCKTIMYPGPTGAPENHRKGVCADGVRQKPKADSVDKSLPEWPQPSGIFTDGTHFNPIKFLSTVRELYEKVSEDTASKSGREFSMEDEAFAIMLNSRVQFTDNRALFQLFDLVNVAGTPTSLITEVDGFQYLYIDCLGST